MKFKMDENLPVEAAELPRAAGHDAITVVEQLLGGRPDPDIALICQREGRALVTLDTDFADIRAYPPTQFPGLIVLRLRFQSKPHVLGTLGRVTPLFLTERLERRLWIVDEDNVRIRE
jgi:predicted nuclease of predicted toxin-antitoxin system